MKTCLKCQKEFPGAVVIDGKKRKLQGRKYCLDCSPFGKHTNQHKIKSGGSMKYGVSAVPYSKRRYKDTTPEYKARLSKNAGERRKRQCARAIELKGGCCCICGYKKSPWALDFHHVNPKLKSFGVSRKWGAAWELILTELAKCILVCRNCHREIEAGITTVPEECLKGIVY